MPPRPLASISADADGNARAALAKYRQFQQYRTPRPVAAVSVVLNSNFMLQSISAEIIYCRERARQAREKADTASAAEAKRDHLAAEARWLSLAHSHELQQQLSTMLADTATSHQRRVSEPTHSSPKLSAPYAMRSEGSSPSLAYLTGMTSLPSRPLG